MKNANLPAMPQSGTEGMSGDLNSSEDWGGMGLTKREHFAAMAMQGILTDKKVNIETDHCADSAAYHAVRMADALLAALEESK